MGAMDSFLPVIKTTQGDSTKKSSKRNVFYANTVNTIVIDPGHGGRDGGASGTYTVEKKIVLAIAKLVKAKMATSLPDVNVILTRDDNTFIPLWKRADIANTKKADLFISIHCNAFTQPTNCPLNYSHHAMSSNTPLHCLPNKKHLK